MPVTATQTQGLVDTWGGKFSDIIDWTGPKLYVPGTGELIPASAFGCPNNLLYADSSVSVSGTYCAICRPYAAGGYTTWYLQILVMATGLEAGAIDLSAEKFKVWGFGV
jgi:hypothetical protein